MNRTSAASGFLQFLGVAVAIIALWVVLSLEPIKQLHDAFTALREEREQVRVLQERVAQLERQLKSIRALGPDLEIELRKSGMAKPGEKVIIIKPESAQPATTAPLAAF